MPTARASRVAPRPRDQRRPGEPPTNRRSSPPRGWAASPPPACPTTAPLLTPGTPALNQFPVNAWRRARDRALQAAPSATLGCTVRWEPALRAAIAQYLPASRGCARRPSHVITEGAQGALALCVQLLTNPGDTAWLEEPGYRGAKSAFHAGDLDVVPMRVDADGLAITEDAWRKPPRLIQATPTHQYPTGAVLSVARRLDLLERARRVGGSSRTTMTANSATRARTHRRHAGGCCRTPRCCTWAPSADHVPGAAAGFLVLPPALAASATPSIIEMLRGAPPAGAADHGDLQGSQFSRHRDACGACTAKRQAALRDALAAHMDVDREVLGGHSGLHLTVRLPPCFPDTRIAEQAPPRHDPNALSSFAVAAAGTTDW